MRGTSSPDADRTRTRSEVAPDPAADELLEPSEGDKPIAAAGLIGRFCVLRPIGQGGMGRVYAAYDPQLDRRVAIKVLFSSATGADEAGGRLLREAQALARLSHPNVVAVHEVDTFRDRWFVAMEYVEGETLRTWFDTQALPRRRFDACIDILLQAGRGLGAAHGAGVVHRDFKPSNVVIGRDGRVRVLDFGVAHAADSVLDAETEAVWGARARSSVAAGGLTLTGRVVGTPAYMAPEQFDRRSADPKVDQFAFCVVAWEMLFGCRPFEAVEPAARLEQIRQRRWSKRGSVEGLPGGVEAILERGLSADPGKRFPGLGALLDSIEERVGGAPQRQFATLRSGMFVAGALVLATGTGATAWFEQRSQLCSAGPSLIAQTWSDEEAERVQSALIGTGVPYAADTWNRVKDEIDGYANAWAETHQEVCAATSLRGEQSTEAMDFRMGCLEERRHELRAMLRVLGDADPQVVERAVTMVAGLERPADCATEKAEPADALPENDELRRKVLEVREQLEKVDALLQAGRVETAVPLAIAATARARELDHARTLTRALSLQAAAHQHDSRTYDATERLLEETVLKAADGGDARREAEAWISLIWLKGRLQQKPDQAMAWRIPAEAALRRASRPGGVEIRFLNSVAAVLEAQGQYDDALGFQRESLRLAEVLYGYEHPTVADLRGNFGVMLARTDQYQEAKAYLRTAVELNERIRGREHPDVALYAQNLGNVLLEIGENSEAREQFERAHAIRVEAFGPGHTKVAESLLALGLVDRQEGNLESAERQLAVAFDTFVEAYGTEDLRIAFTLTELAAVSEARGRWLEAEARLRKALAVYERKHAPTHFHRARAHVALCRSLRETGDLAQAEQQCRIAVDGLGQRSHPDDADLADAQVQLAETLVLQGQVAEACDLLERGARGLREGGRPADEVERVEQRLADVGAKASER